MKVEEKIVVVGGKEGGNKTEKKRGVKEKGKENVESYYKHANNST